MTSTTNGPRGNDSSEWRAGWPLVLASAAGIGLASIPTYTLGVFITPLRQQFGWSLQDIVLAQTGASLLMAIASPLAGTLMDRFGARPLALTGCLLLSATMASLAWNGGSLPIFYAIWALLAISLAVGSPIVWQKAIVDRFERQRGLATSVALCGSNIAGGISPVLAAALIVRYGWQTAYLGLGAYMLVTALPLAYFFFHDSRSLDRRSKVRRAQAQASTNDQAGLSLAETLRTREFWALAVSFFCAGAGITGFIVHFAPMLISQGASTLAAASAISILSISAICGRLAAGWLMDRMFAPHLAIVAMALPMLGMAMLFTSPTYAAGVAAGVSVGLSTGAEYNMISYLAVRYFGLRRYGSIASYLSAAFTLGCTCGPLVVAWSVASQGSYGRAMLWLGSAFCIAALAMVCCRRYEMPARAN